MWSIHTLVEFWIVIPSLFKIKLIATLRTMTLVALAIVKPAPVKLAPFFVPTMDLLEPILRRLVRLKVPSTKIFRGAVPWSSMSDTF